MILIERLNAQIQVGNTSYALVSSRPQNNNPMLEIYLSNGNFIWDFLGLRIGTEDEIEDEPRQNHFDFYIGLDDLIAYRNQFPAARARSLGLAAGGLRIPTAKVRPGGKPIAWRGPLARFEFEDIKISLPPYKINADTEIETPLNIDREFSPYPINNRNGRTKREIHFGFENPFIIRKNLSIKVPRIQVVLTPQQYATVLEAVDAAIAIHTRI